jgi:hypothetical protein
MLKGGARRIDLMVKWRIEGVVADHLCEGIAIKATWPLEAGSQD